MAGELTPNATLPKPKAKPLAVKSFRCPGCGAPITLRGMGNTRAAACESCGSVIDVTTEEYRILEKATVSGKYPGDIPLGKRGLLRGTRYEVIGFMQRSDATGDYVWEEYLLFNPYTGFRWLVEYHGHWTLFTMIKERPAEGPGDGVRFRGDAFKHYVGGKAVVVNVHGEFYWRVTRGDASVTQDYVNPPLTLSSERSADETVWSLGEYITAAEVAAAFSLADGALPAKTGVGAAQPLPGELHPIRTSGLLALFMAALVFIQIVSVASARDEAVFSGGFTARREDPEKIKLTAPFELTGRSAAVAIGATAPVHNNWLFLDAALEEETTGRSYPCPLELSFYSGTDSDGAWSEGSQQASCLLPAVPAGRYRLSIEPQLSPEILAGLTPVPPPAPPAGDLPLAFNPAPPAAAAPASAAATAPPSDLPPGFDFQISVARGVTPWGNFWLLELLLLLPLLIVLGVWYSFEKSRWSDSDHPWGQSGSGDDE